MFSVHDLEALEECGRAHGMHEHALKRFRIAFFKKGLPLAECLAVLPAPAREAAE